MKQIFSERLLKSLEAAAPGKRNTIWYAALPSFGIRVTDKGKKSFFVFRRPRGSPKAVRLALGPFPVIPLAAARERARAVLLELEAGNNPRELAHRRQQADQIVRSNTFAKVAEDFIRRYASKERTAIPIAQLIRGKLVSK
jgi:hypothetical protein